jgi:predicted transcriptional regulator
LPFSELNQTALVSYCGLNLKKHKNIFDDLESNDLISRNEISYGKGTAAMYEPTHKGIEFCSRYSLGTRMMIIVAPNRNRMIMLM